MAPVCEHAVPVGVETGGSHWRGTTGTTGTTGSALCSHGFEHRRRGERSAGTMPETSRLQFPSVDSSTDPARHAAYLTNVAAVTANPRAEALKALHLQPGLALLDAGSRVGRYVSEIAPRLMPGGSLVALDALQPLGTSPVEMVSTGSISSERARAMEEDLASRDRAGTFIATMVV
jgi:hypothetical protein